MWGKPKNPKPTNLSKLLDDEKAMSEIIIDSIDDGMALIDFGGQIRKFNPAAAKITGWKQDEAQSLDWELVFKFVNDKGVPIRSADTAIGKTLASGRPERDSASYLHAKSGTQIALSLSVSPLGNIQNASSSRAVVAIFRDVSDERAQENQRAEFISTASHEMRTPVAAIEGYLSLALNDKVSSIDMRARGYLEKAHAATRHLGELFQDLLTSAKAEDGRLVNHPQVVEIGSFMERLLEELRFVADKKDLAIELTTGNSHTIDASSSKVVNPLYYVLADPDRLKEVITNLFDNAVKYTPAGKITLGLTGDDSVVQVFVRDTGPGIPREDIGHLFQKFYRVDSSATRTIGGTGLGLFICRKIIELYNGQIWADSEIGQGSTFYINLPRLTAAQANKIKMTQVGNNQVPA